MVVISMVTSDTMHDTSDVLHVSIVENDIQVKDDPKLIRKTLKREHAKKVKSAKQWAERKEKSEGSKNSKIDKRMSNIKKYRGKRLGLEEEGGEKPKTGRRPPPSATKQSPTAPKQARPGFEGNRKGFGFHKRKEEQICDV